MNLGLYTDFYLEQWKNFKRLTRYFWRTGILLLSLIPLTEIYFLIFERKSLIFAKPVEKQFLLSFVAIYIAIALRYLRVELVLRALKQENKERAVKVLSVVSYASIILMIPTTLTSLVLFLNYRNFYLGLWLEVALLFYFLFAVPRLYHLEDLLGIIEFPLLSKY